MIFRELQANLQNLIPDRKISQTDIANVLNMTRANISLRVKNKSEVTVSELQKLERHFGVSLYKSPLPITLTPKYNLGIQYDMDNWGKRLLKLQVAGQEILAIKTNFSDTNIDWLLFGEQESF